MNWFELSEPQILELRALVGKAFDRRSFAKMLQAMK